MSSGFEGAGWLWRFIGGDEAPGMWHHTDNAEHVELIRRLTVCEVRDLAFADDVRQLAEQRTELLEALGSVMGNCLDSEALAAAYAKARTAIANATQQRKEPGA